MPDSRGSEMPSTLNIEPMLDVDVVEARASKSRPTLGIVKFKCTVRNAAGQALAEMTSPILIKRREGAV